MDKSSFYEKILDSHNFERDVYSILSKCIDKAKGESITDGFNAIQEDTKDEEKPYHFIPDYFLPKGCRALEIPEKSFIEVKYRLTYNAYGSIKNLRDSLPNEYKLIIISLDPIPTPKTDYGIKGRDVTYITYDEIREKSRNLIEGVTPKQNHPIQSHQEKEELNEQSGSDGKVKDIIRDVHNEYKKGNITLFLGAGVSLGAGLPTWTKLLENLLEDGQEISLNQGDFPAIEVASFNSTIIAARILLSNYSPEQEFDIANKLKDALYKSYDKTKKNDLIEVICTACKSDDTAAQRKVTSIITTNYDDLVEQELEKQKIDYFQVFKEGKYEGSKLPVIHVHGCLNYENPNPIMPVLSEKAYHELYKKNYDWSNIEILHALYRHTCIFIGCSMSDPNLRRLLEFVRTEDVNDINHYAILQLRPLCNHNWDSSHPQKYYEKVERKELEFRRRQEDVFHELGINVIWYEDGKHEQIVDILKMIIGEKTIDYDNPIVKLNSGKL